MLRVILSTFLFLISFSGLFAQITIETERDSDWNVLFFAVNPTKLPYPVVLNFSQLQNMTTPGGGNATAIASSGRSKVATLNRPWQVKVQTIATSIVLPKEMSMEKLKLTRCIRFRC